MNYIKFNMKLVSKKANTIFRKIFLLFFTILMCYNHCIGQEQEKKYTKFSYLEVNGGIAKTYEVYDYFVGFGVLWGETYIYKNNFVFDWEIGPAFPTLATTKLGIGLHKIDHTFTVGIRPYPFTTYFQIGFPPNKNGHWLISFEYNPRSENTNFSGFSNGNINIGYRMFRDK